MALPSRPAADEERALQDAQLAAQDALLVERVRRGDGAAFGELVTRHMRRAFSIAYRILEHREDAEDVVQDACIRALEHIATLEKGRPFRPWFHRIVVNRALNVRRSRTLRATHAIPDNVPAATAAADSAAEQGMLRRHLREALDCLPERQRLIVQLADLEELSSAEIGAILDIADGTVRWHLHQARRTLREELAALKEE
jgi:RNA polymerase sigma-70 factor, ECF subfamily